MMNKDIIDNLQHLRALRAGGVPNPEWVRGARATLMMQVKNTMDARSFTHVRPRHAWQMLEMFVPSPAVRYVLRPVTVLGSIFVLVFGGWIASVNASLQSVPGDSLYNLKIATEHAQIALAAGNEIRVKLQIDFAGRRVEEVAKILETPGEKKAERVATAVAELKKGLSTTEAGLKELTQSDPEKVSEVIKTLDRKVAEYHISLDKTAGNNSEPVVQEKVAEAKQIVSDLASIPALVTASSTPRVDAALGSSSTPPVVLPPLPPTSSGSSTFRIAPPTRSDKLPVVK